MFQNLEFTIQVPDEVLNLSREFQGPMDELIDAAALYISDAYKYYVVVVGAVDTGELLHSIHVEEGPGRVKYIRASADHAMVVEVGWIHRARGQASYPGRYPAQKAVESFLEGLNNGEIVDALNWRMGR